MTRVLLLVAAAFALVVGIASAKTHTVVVTSVALDKTTVVAGDSLVATYKVKNNLEKTSNPRTVRFFLTLDEDGKRGFKGVAVGSKKTPKITAKSSKTLSEPLTVPGDTAAGSYLVLACISGECEATDLRVTVHAAAPAQAPVSFLYFPASGVGFGGWFHTSETVDLALVNSSATETSGPVSLAVATDSGSGHFTIESTTCGGALAPGALCMVYVSFTPVGISSGATTGRLVATATPGIVGPVEVQLSGSWACTDPTLRLAPRGC